MKIFYKFGFHLRDISFHNVNKTHIYILKLLLNMEKSSGKAQYIRNKHFFQFRTCVFQKRGYITCPLQANLAQSVEQLIRNEQVIGSNPMIGSIFLSELPVLCLNR